MIKCALTIFVLFFSTMSFANSLCSDSSGKIRIDTTLYRGGAQPGPQVHIKTSSQLIYVNDVLVSQAQSFSDGVGNTVAVVGVHENEQAHHVFEEKHTRTNSYTVYGGQFTLTGDDLPQDYPIKFPVTAYLICTDSQAFIP